MLAGLALALVSVSYQLPSAPIKYGMKVEFDGYLPILGGQPDAKANVDMGFTVKKLEADSEGNPQAVSELVRFEMTFGGAPLPFTLDNVKAYFPKNTVSHNPLGKIIKNDAPSIELPVRLPGLDVKRVPDITYMPIEFPEGGIEVGKPFEFKKKFGDSEVTYTVVPKSIEGSTVKLDVKMQQRYENLEDEAKNLTIKQDEAFAKVETTVSGVGTVTFDTSKGIVTESTIQATAKSIATEIKGGATSERSLKTTLNVSLEK